MPTNKDTMIRTAQSRHANLPGRIAEAAQNIAYWQVQKQLRTHPVAREQAIASHSAWKMTHERLRAEFAAR